jgi:hypothetical protein
LKLKNETTRIVVRTVVFIITLIGALVRIRVAKEAR